MFKVTESIEAKFFQRKKLAKIARLTESAVDVDGQMYPSREFHGEFLALDGVVTDWASAVISSVVNLFFKRAPFWETMRAAAWEANCPACFHGRPLVMP